MRERAYKQRMLQVQSGVKAVAHQALAEWLMVLLGKVLARGSLTDASGGQGEKDQGHIGCSDREAKTELDEDAEQGRSNVKAERLTRRSMEPRPGMRLPLELQVGPEGFTAGAGDKELLDHSAIQRLRQRLLSGRRRRRDRDMVGGQHELVVEGSGSVEEWPGRLTNSAGLVSNKAT
ncbi:unnamed protein product [Symbiodinium natans]|uniref:Uncharacterized protein n=1 Tax=Symbiodinium natans TaxID=878477 RepID=A0A812NIV1_9DINO|nr:unnamed protein product [Symbiodinium natans]